MYENDYANEYTIWTVREMKKLRYLVDAKGNSWDEVGYVLRRKPSACKRRYHLLQVGDMMNRGYDDDTVISYRKDIEGKD